ncbi:MAG: hypothetical protein A3J74_08315 [Elusimicrobia bacterium RIFCSPHIGHO2_02_FULL_57_9]|nr:MAG: hypothetical protein A3J74_08315 [Elusimicrobia bacterium RIFCSPHIGHO2_02_FULL_57_9]
MKELFHPAIETLFSPGGALASVEARYESRPQQMEMASAVTQSLEQGKNLVVEAATGVGKSLAYLLPGALWAVDNGKRLVVSTYTRALQEQILEKELPVAVEVLNRLGRCLRYAMLQGADNYLCVQRLARLRSTPDLFGNDGSSLVEELSRWAAGAGSGHRSRIPRLVPQGLWSRIARDPELCQGPGGRFWGSCLYRKDRDKAERSHILVVNHALLLSGARLPDHDALIIDEAYNLEEAAVSRFGVSVSSARVFRIVEEVSAWAKIFPELSDLADQFREEAGLFFESLIKEHDFNPRQKEPVSKLFLEGPGLQRLPCLEKLEAGLLKLNARHLAEDEEPELRLLHGRAVLLHGDIERIFTDRAEDSARWIEYAQGHVDLRAAPLDVSRRLGKGLFGRDIPVIMTSATLSSGHGLGDFKAHVGCEGARELMLDSPFDYKSQAALLLMDDLPEPSEDGKYLAAVALRCRRIIEKVPGGLFILFSSWKTMRGVHQRLKRKVKDRPLWIQGASGNEAILSDFASAGNAVLLGVDTFWQGVDVPGSALSCVVLVKLPFSNYGSPVEQSRRRWYESLGRGYFEDYSLPRAVMKFRQGFGRLIRCSTDRGAVVVLDSRLLHRGYGRAFLEAVPSCRRLESIVELGAFFEK